MKADLIARSSSKALLWERIKYTMKTKVELTRNIANAQWKLQSMADDPQQFKKMMQWSEDIEEIFIKIRDTQKAKFVRLSHEARSTRPCTWRRLDRSKVVINFSHKELDEDEMALLSCGLNFTVAPKAVPKHEIIASTEALAWWLDKQEPGRGTNLRKRVQRCLEEAKEPTQNLSPAEMKAMMNMMKDQSIVVLLADKEMATVVMDREMYNGKMMSL